MEMKLLGILVSTIMFGSFSSSTHYKLQNYGVNSGGTNSSASSTYQTQSTTGEISGSQTNGSTSGVKSGSVPSETANVPGAPTLSNGSGTYYNKLNVVIDTGGNPSDATFEIEVATNSGFSSPQYVQADGTLGGSQLYQNYTSWGGGSGSFVISLSANTTYWFRESAQTGKFTASPFGPSANISTVNPALSFSLSPNNLNMGVLTASSVITSPTITMTFTTNAVNGGKIYLSGTATGLVSTYTGHTINVPPPSGDLGSLSEGFGAQSASASGGLTAQSPYSSTGTVVGSIYTSFVPLYSASSAVSSSTETLNLKARSATTTPAGTDYKDTLTFVAAANY